jgi:hypothetical protein
MSLNILSTEGKQIGLPSFGSFAHEVSEEKIF